MQSLSPNPPPRWLDRVVLLAIAAVIATGIYAAWCWTPMLWDGSYQFAATLQAGKPYAYLSRFHTHILWRPVVWLMPFTDNVRLLQAVYGLPFLLAPAVGLGCSWWFVRRHMPTLIVWAAIGILATPLPGQIFVINDSVFQQHLFWPVFLGLLVQLTRRQKVVWLLLAVFQFVHQIGLILLAGATVTTLILAWRPWERGRFLAPLDGDRATTPTLPGAFIVALTLTLLIAAKVWWTSIPGTPYYDSYAAAEASWQAAVDRWWKSVWGAPFNGLRLVWLSAGLVCLQAWLFRQPERERRARMVGSIALLVLLVGVLHWTAWASTPIGWGGAIEYRRWLVPLTLPIFALATIEAIWRPSQPPPAPDSADADAPSQGGSVYPLRVAVIVLLAGVYAVVIGRQSTQVREMSQRLAGEIAASEHATIVLPQDHWLRETPLNHWSLGWYSLVLQGREPTRWIAPTDLPAENLRALDRSPPALPISKFDDVAPDAGGWFDWTTLVRRAAEER